MELAVKKLENVVKVMTRKVINLEEELVNVKDSMKNPVLNKTKEEWIEFKKKKTSINEDDILEMIALRNKAREDKNYKEADIIRDKLLDKGVLIEDKDGKTIWKLK